MDNHHKKILGWVIVLLGSAASAAVALLYIRILTGSFLPAILPQLENDTIYYLTHVQKVLQGHGSLGNPYILEYRDAVFPGLKLAVYLSALPGIVLGLPINTVFATNAILYSVITGAVLYVISLQLTKQSIFASALIAVLGTSSLHNLIIRPAIMQTVYPVFAIFTLAVFGVITKPQSITRCALLGLVTAFSFYLYPHLWMQTFTTVGLLYIATLFGKDRRSILNLTIMGIGIIVLCLPQILTTIQLFTEPMAQLINLRSGLVNTHSVLPLTLLNNKYTILIVVTLLLLRLRRTWTAGEFLLLLLSSSVFIAATSNVVTGKLMDFHSHPWRLGLMVNVVGIVVLLKTVQIDTDRIVRWCAGLCAAALLLTTVSRVCIRMNAYFYIPQHERMQREYDIQKDTEQIITFLTQENIHNSVIATPVHVGYLLPLYTDNTVLFVSRASLHILPQEELLERFLTQHVDRIDETFLRENVDRYAGLNYIEEAKYQNAYRKPANSIEPIDLLGGDSYIQSVLTKHHEINQDYENYLQKFNVSYIVIDKEVNSPRVPRSAENIYTDGRFSIYRLP